MTAEARLEQRTGERTYAVLQLIRAATAARPLPVVLGELCRSIAEVAPAPVVSTYLREREGDTDVLVLRANVGLAPGAVDNVRLAVGEGITGFAAECMHPVSATVAPADEHFKPIPGIGEEPFPVFLAVPLLLEGRMVGALVLQRSAAEPFSDADVVLCAALSTAICLALEAAWGRRRDRRTKRRAGTRTVRLRAVRVVGGAVLARLLPLPVLSSLAAELDPDQLEAGFERVRADVRSVTEVYGPALGDRCLSHLAAANLWLDDQRFRDRFRQLCKDLGPVRGMHEVMRSYAQTAHRMGAQSDGGMWVRARADDLAGLCLVVSARASRRKLCKAGSALLIPDAPNMFVATHAVRFKAAAVLVGGELLPGSTVAELLAAAKVVTLADVAGLGDWARIDDTLSVDGDRGTVVVHPSADEVARVRAEARRERAEGV